MQVSDLPIHSKAAVLFENDNLFVLDKPDGVLSHPNKTEAHSSILLAPYNDNNESFDVGGQHVYLIHRIDKETSGCLLFAKNSQTAKQLKKDFIEHKVLKNYIALVAGFQRQPTTWKDHLAKDGGKMRYDRDKKTNAETDVEAIEVFEKPRLTLLKLSPKSGKTHQLRIQAAKRNLPILGDRQYGNFPRNKDVKTKFLLKRMFLHSTDLTFIDPLTKKEVHVRSLLPPNLQIVLDKIKLTN